MCRTCIIIPIYNEYPKEQEIISIDRNTTVLEAYDIYFVHPKSMDIKQYEKFDAKEFVPFSDSYFTSNKTYSRLILSEEFYKPFMDYDYMLIAQTDSYILNTNYSLNQFVEKGYDYWGAPWLEGPFDTPYGVREYIKLLFVRNASALRVGNGGFSLRKVNTTYALVKKHRLFLKLLWKLNEDLFFSNCARANEKVVVMSESRCVNARYTAAPMSEALKFALEKNIKAEIEAGNIPYAVHAWEKYMEKDIRAVYSENR